MIGLDTNVLLRIFGTEARDGSEAGFGLKD